MITLLITGGAGFIGSSFIKYELQNHPEYRIINLDKLDYCANLENLKSISDNPNYSFVLGDICNKKITKELIKQSDYIINFAAQTHVDNSIKNPEIFFKTNVFLLRFLFLTCNCFL